eukprot:7960723-Pyramimonas_sp.AAC.1
MSCLARTTRGDHGPALQHLSNETGSERQLYTLELYLVSVAYRCHAICPTGGLEACGTTRCTIL